MFVPLPYIVCLSPYSQDVCPPWSLRGCWWFMRGVFVVLEILDVPRVHQGCYISIFRYLPSWKVVKLLQSGRPWFSRAPSKCPPWSLRGPWWLPRGVLVVFYMVDAPRIHQGSYISIFRSLPSWEVLHLLCVSRVST